MKAFSQLTGMEKLVELVRWVCVPVAAVLTVAVLRTCARLAMPPLLAQPPGSPPMAISDFQRFYLTRLFGVLMAAGFVIAGAIVAPRYRRVAAVVLAMLWILQSLLIHVLIDLGRGKAHYTHFLVDAAAAVGGVFLILLLEKARARPGLRIEPRE